MADESQSWGGALTAQQLGDLAGLTEEQTWGGALTKAQLIALAGGGNNPSPGTSLPAVSPSVTAGTNAQGQSPLTADLNIIVTTSGNPSGCTLPVGAANKKITVVNRGVNPVNLYPAAGGQIDGLGNNNPVLVAATCQIEFQAINETQWYSSRREVTDFNTIVGRPTTLSGYGVADAIANSYGTGGLIQRNLSGVTFDGPRRGIDVRTWPINTPSGFTAGSTIAANNVYIQSAIPTPGGGINSGFRVWHDVLSGDGPGEINTLHSVASLQANLNRDSQYYAIVSQSSHAYSNASQTSTLGGTTGYSGGQPLPNNTNADFYYKGELFAGNDNAWLGSGAAYFRNLVGREINTSINLGASTFSRYGLLVFHKGEASAEKVDANVAFGSDLARIGLQFGLGNSAQPGVRPDGTLIAGQKNLWGNAPYNGQLVAANGIDFSMFNFSGSAFKSVGFNVGPTGVVDCTSGSTKEVVFTVIDGESVVLNPLNGPIQLWTLGANRTPSATVAGGQRFRLMINDGAGFTVNWATIGVAWVGGSPPALATTGWTVIDFWTVGATVYGHLIGNVQ